VRTDTRLHPLCPRPTSQVSIRRTQTRKPKNTSHEMVNFPPRVLYGLAIICLILIPITVIARIFILWHVPYSKGRTFTHVTYTLFGISAVASAAIVLKIMRNELDIEKEIPGGPKWDQEVFLALFTEEFSRLVFVVAVLYNVTLWFIKAAFLSFFFSLYPYLPRWQQLMLWIVTGYIIVTGAVVFITQFAWCKPFNTNWSNNFSVRCDFMEDVQGVIIQSWANITSDIMILIIPIYTFRSLNLPKPEQYALWVVLIIGLVSPVMALCRFVVLYEVARDPAMFGLSLLRANLAWALLEGFMANAAFFLPALRVFIRRKGKSLGLSNWETGAPSRPQTYDVDAHGIHVKKTITLEFASRKEMGSDVELTSAGAGPGALNAPNHESW